MWTKCRLLVAARCCCIFFFFFFSSRRRHTRFDCDWSSDVCSSDLERTREIEGGVDASFMRGRASLELSLYQRTTSDLLVPVTPAPSQGYGLQFLNGGKIRNEGIEIGAGITPVQQANASWVFRTTFTSLKNRALELDLPGGAQGVRPANAGDGLSYGEFFVQVGRPITQIIGYDAA